MATDINTNLMHDELTNDDHRIIGLKQKLFLFHESSPGSCFFLPHGTIIYNKLADFMRNEYHKRGYNEVITPNIFNKKLWEISGHWQHYQKNMFQTNIDDNIYALKPINCCGHCLIFDSTNRSYRDLPIRLADFGVLHRNECHGALTGLTRVRKFCQDDAHIFCTEEQIETEIDACLNFLTYVYKIFGFDFELVLSTRPDSYVGTVEIWNNAEEKLTIALNKSGFKWSVNPGDGAFYGPKIDISLKDAMQRKHQCGTIQLDFNLPNKFNLCYQKSDGTNGIPVIIHRAILGSIERMFAILCEHYGGKWPFWLSPRQICIIPVNPKYNDFANKIAKNYHDKHFCVEIDTSSDKLNKKIRNAQIEQFNFIFVVGEKEQSTNTVNVRTRNGKILGMFEHHNLISKLISLRNEYSTDDLIETSCNIYFDKVTFEKN